MLRRKRLILVVGLLGVLVWGVMPTHATPAPQQGAYVAYNSVVQGQISDTVSEESWRFRGQTGDLILIDMRALAPGLDASLTLTGPDNAHLITDDDSGIGFNARIGPFELPSNGEYTIRAGHYSGTGTYLLEVRNLRTIPTLVSGKPLVGLVNADHPNDFFWLDLPDDTADGTLWRLDITAEQPASGPMIALYTTDELVATTEGQIDPGFLDPIVPLPNASYIVAVTWNAEGTGDAYEIALHESALELLTDGASQSGTLDTDTPNRKHYFQGTDGQMIRVSVRTGDDIAPALEIRSIDYNAYLFFNEGGYTREQQVTLELPMTAVYMITVRDGSFAGHSGDYTLEFEVLGE